MRRALSEPVWWWRLPSPTAVGETPTNYMATVKPIVDGLVDAGVLPDDDAKHLLGPDLRRHPEVTKKRLAQPVYEFHLSLYERGGLS